MPSADSNPAMEHPKVTLIHLGNGTYRVNGMNRSAVTGRLLTEPRTADTLEHQFENADWEDRGD